MAREDRREEAKWATMGEPKVACRMKYEVGRGVARRGKALRGVARRGGLSGRIMARRTTCGVGVGPGVV
jgi:hypothetical protein